MQSGFFLYCCHGLRNALILEGLDVALRILLGSRNVTSRVTKRHFTGHETSLLGS